MAQFLFYVTLTLFAGGAINMHNAGKVDVYAENPDVLVKDIGDAIETAFTESGPITQDEYEKRYND